jgi:hypothetical protein
LFLHQRHLLWAMSPRARRWGRRALVLAPILLVSWSPLALAQALTPPAGTAIVGVGYEYFIGGDHLFSTDSIDGLSTRGYVAEGNRWDLGDDRAHTIFASVDLGLTNRLAVAIGGAVVTSAYFGRAPVDIAVDDGRYHTRLQDGTVRVRTPLSIGSFIVTPFLGTSFPLSNYPLSGHSSPGTGLVTIQAGLHSVRGLGEYGLLGYVGADIEYSDVTNVGTPDGVVKGTVRVGYFRSSRLTFTASGTWIDTVGGLEWISDDPTAPSAHGANSSTSFHNRVTAARSALVGFGVGYDLTRRVGLSVGVSKTVWGENVEDATLISSGLSWSVHL